MQVLDEKFRVNKLRYVFQCLLATLSVFFILLVLDAQTHSAIVAALGASSFIVFTMPDTQSSRPRFLIGGYLMGMVAGVLCHTFFSLIPLQASGQLYLYALFGALSVGSSIFLMVITNTEHPPAAGLALALILNEWTAMTLLIVITGIILLSVLRQALKPIVMNLL